MNPANEPLLAGLFVVVLLVLGGASGWRQLRMLRRLPDSQEFDPNERRFLRGQARRRLLIAGLLLLLAGLIGGTYLSGMEGRVSAIGAAPAEEGAPHPIRGEDAKQFAKFYAAYWSAVMLVLFAVMAVATVDFWAIHRFGNRQMRNIRVARQAMLDQELARLRAERGRDGPAGL
jgi:hypothetical protein